ncbi:hypothetical protein H9X96_20250 [Pedobacter sp. N36a]|uniref:hypothetical protein n=1 Tax=Pedobacter sp. N36a TaxID=2767996 RepID=UPI0016575627|nr:hypothetical protein [Pedobacter sp. N36a]MBC8988092.1 hypothetical protein [Pedobacter sp. N36a]
MFKVELVNNERDPIVLSRSLKGDHEDVAEGIIEFPDKYAAQLVITIPREYRFLEGLFHQRLTNRLANRLHLLLVLVRAEL